VQDVIDEDNGHVVHIERYLGLLDLGPAELGESSRYMVMSRAPTGSVMPSTSVTFA
jgi:hypothetical protein